MNDSANKLRERPPVLTYEHEDVAWHGHVRFRIPPHCSRLILDGAVPSSIIVKLGKELSLIVSGDPNMLGGIDTEHGELIQGMLTVKRSFRFPERIASLRLEVGGPSRQPRFELEHFAVSGGMDLLGRGWNKAHYDSVIQVTLIGSVREHLAA